jgi:hypothetical protein
VNKEDSDISFIALTINYYSTFSGGLAWKKLASLQMTAAKQEPE